MTSLPQSSTVTILDARSSDSADDPFSSVRARRVMVVAAAHATIMSRFMKVYFTPASPLRRFTRGIVKKADPIESEKFTAVAMKSPWIHAVSMGLYFMSNGCSANAESVSYIRGDCEEIKKVQSAFGNGETYEVWKGCGRANMPWRQVIRGVIHDNENDVLKVPPQILVDGTEIKGYFCSSLKVPDGRVNRCTSEGWKTVLK